MHHSDVKNEIIANRYARDEGNKEKRKELANCITAPREAEKRPGKCKVENTQKFA